VKPLNSILIKFTICLIIGIVLSNSTNISLQYLFYILAIILFVLVIVFLISNKQFKKNIWFGSVAFISMIGIGMLTHQLHDQSNFQNHYTKLTELNNNKPKLIRFKIRERLKPSTYHNKYVVNLIRIDSQNVTGKCLLNISKDSLNFTYNIDDIVLIHSEFKNVNPPLNPNQFDYKAYLEKQYIYHQLSTESNALLLLESTQHSIFGYAAKLRDQIKFRVYMLE